MGNVGQNKDKLCGYTRRECCGSGYSKVNWVERAEELEKINGRVQNLKRISLPNLEGHSDLEGLKFKHSHENYVNFQNDFCVKIDENDNKINIPIS